LSNIKGLRVENHRKFETTVEDGLEEINNNDPIFRRKYKMDEIIL
jgi:hypothetical protein